VIAVVCNWQPIPQVNYAIGVPVPGRWVELLNSDALNYGGLGVGNAQGVEAAAPPMHGYPYSLSLTIPPLSVLWLQPELLRRPANSKPEP
jgi:1,4-alpha-glucan branching enzyme